MFKVTMYLGALVLDNLGHLYPVESVIRGSNLRIYSYVNDHTFTGIVLNVRSGYSIPCYVTLANGTTLKMPSDHLCYLEDLAPAFIANLMVGDCITLVDQVQEVVAIDISNEYEVDITLFVEQPPGFACIYQPPNGSWLVGRSL